MLTYSSSVSQRPSETLWLNNVNKSYYQDDQQAKLQHLQAEVDSLLHQLQNLKKQRLAEHKQEEKE
ncbi:hypothetical protein [Umezakia ovalisporum]|jgi:hypothetical protein|uniref:hypothetical protein n=1 Tax=Umezakia ovalisporum TaxID=75695 RepID=UPI000B27715A|nr:hypothetical protein [Umezakia ovalisporum]MDH6085671.1 hypothetical protein [Umezakia ovalisporum TAC611]MDH6086777.1 hypothetical protein [Umezakia ovalisporum Ak1311]